MGNGRPRYLILDCSENRVRLQPSRIGTCILSSLVIVIAMCGGWFMSDTRAASKAATTQSHIALQTLTFKSGDRALFGGPLQATRPWTISSTDLESWQRTGARCGSAVRLGCVDLPAGRLRRVRSRTARTRLFEGKIYRRCDPGDTSAERIEAANHMAVQPPGNRTIGRPTCVPCLCEAAGIRRSRSDCRRRMLLWRNSNAWLARNETLDTRPRSVFRRLH